VPAYCRGGYRFRVARDGTWLAGPDPSGFSVSGRLSKSERRRLRRARCWAAPQDNRRIVIVVKQFRVSAKTVTVQGPERAVTLDGAGGQLNPSCAPGRPAAAELFAFADALLQRYYPPPLHSNNNLISPIPSCAPEG
jgi:hypothetical protein